METIGYGLRHPRCSTRQSIGACSLLAVSVMKTYGGVFRPFVDIACCVSPGSRLISTRFSVAKCNIHGRSNHAHSVILLSQGWP